MCFFRTPFRLCPEWQPGTLKRKILNFGEPFNYIHIDYLLLFYYSVQYQYNITSKTISIECFFLYNLSGHCIYNILFLHYVKLNLTLGAVKFQN